MRKEEIDPRYQAILRVVEKYCLAYENPLLVDKYAHYFREGYDAYGLSEAEVYTLRDQILSDYPLSVEEYAELGYHLFSTGKYEFGSLAILLLKNKRDELNRDVFGWIKKWLDSGVENWAHVDMICSSLLSVFLENGIVELPDFEPWRESESRWTRRAIPVALLNMRKVSPPDELMDFLDPMMTDRERVVHQGLGWFLRELWKLEHHLVEEFLKKHKQHCDRLIIQYATEKMNSDKKKKFVREKTDRPERNGRYDRTDRNERSDRPDRNERTERTSNPRVNKVPPRKPQPVVQATPRRKPPKKANHV